MISIFIADFDWWANLFERGPRDLTNTEARIGFRWGVEGIVVVALHRESWLPYEVTFAVRSEGLAESFLGPNKHLSGMYPKFMGYLSEDGSGYQGGKAAYEYLNSLPN